MKDCRRPQPVIIPVGRLSLTLFSFARPPKPTITSNAFRCGVSRTTLFFHPPCSYSCFLVRDFTTEEIKIVEPPKTFSSSFLLAIRLARQRTSLPPPSPHRSVSARPPPSRLSPSEQTAMSTAEITEANHNEGATAGLVVVPPAADETTTSNNTNKRSRPEDLDDDHEDDDASDDSEGERRPDAFSTAAAAGVAAAVSSSNASLLTEDARKLEEKRAYNRKNAARARKRVKDQLSELCRKVESFSDKNEALQEANAELSKRVSALTEENLLLRRLILEKQVTAAGVHHHQGMQSVGPAQGGLSGLSGMVAPQNQQAGFPFSFNSLY